MKFPYTMLMDFVETRLDAEQVGELLTMAGFELEGIEEVEGEPVLDIKVVANRGDGLSVFGLSREVLAKDSEAKPTELYKQSARQFQGDDPTEGPGGQAVQVDIQTADCKRFSCRLFSEVRNRDSPDWLQKRLRQIGQRPISLFVDLTNYVMIEQGQPLHAFDFDKLQGGRIVVRHPAPGEKLTTLDEKEHELQPGQVMICDANRPVGAGGVMGGLETEVSASTQTVLLESANFLNTSIRRTRKQLGLSTDASYRFERSVDPERTVAAIRRFTQLLVGAQGGTPSPAIADYYPGREERPPLRLRLSRANRLLGMTISAEDGRRYLTRLGFSVEDAESHEGLASFIVASPSWRPDIVREDDLIEELGRIHGYEKIPERLPHGQSLVGGTKGYLQWKDKLRESLIRLGLNQTISHGLRGLHPLDNPYLDRIGPRGIADPEMMWLRNSLLPSLADAARVNGGQNLHLFEIGQVFFQDAKGPGQRTMLALLQQGELAPSDWLQANPEKTSFYVLKGFLQESAGAISGCLGFCVSNMPDPRLHPTRQATVLCDDTQIGVMGQIHPDVAERALLPPDTVLAELDVEALYASSEQELHFRAPSRNPAVRRDIAILIDKAVPFNQIEDKVKVAAGEVLERQWLFDVYAGKGIPEGKHSLGLALQLRKMGENFTDDEANQVRERVVQALASLGATPR